MLRAGYYYYYLLALGLAIILNPVWSHEHDKQHSHFCTGTGHSLYCAEGKSLRIDRAWFGRIAHDISCVGSNSTSSSTNSSSVDSHHLDEDCGVSILSSKASWCETIEKGDKSGCIIKVSDDLAPTEKIPCPEGVTKYLYLEYECEMSGGVQVAALSYASVFLLSVLTLSWSWSF